MSDQPTNPPRVQSIAAARALAAEALARARAKPAPPGNLKPAPKHAPPPATQRNQARAPKDKPIHPNGNGPSEGAFDAAQTPPIEGGGNLSVSKTAPASRKPKSPPRKAVHDLHPPAEMTDEEIDRLALLLEATCARPAALAVAKPHVLKAMRAIFTGSGLVGVAGHADRQNLFRFIGLPITSGTPTGGTRGDVARAIGNLGERMERALSAREGGRADMPRRDPVILDAELVTEPSNGGHPWGVTHKTGDLARYDATPAERVEAPAPKAGEAGNKPPPKEEELPSWLD